MRCSLRFGPYDTARFGRPWIGKVIAWPEGSRPELEWGTYVPAEAGAGGSGGQAHVNAEPGDVVRAGQKELASGRSEARWYLASLIPADQNPGVTTEGWLELLEVGFFEVRQAWWHKQHPGQEPPRGNHNSRPAAVSQERPAREQADERRDRVYGRRLRLAPDPEPEPAPITVNWDGANNQGVTDAL